MAPGNICRLKAPRQIIIVSISSYRKHIATTCKSLNLQEQDVSDLANFTGHAEKIQKNIYRQSVLNR